MPPKKSKNNNTRNKNVNKFSTEPYAHDDPDNNLEYAKIVSALGDCRFTCIVNNSPELIGRISGRAKKRGRINVGDIVLVSKRDFETCSTKLEKLDILYKYNDDTAKKLKRWGELDFLTSKDSPEELGEFITYSNEEDHDHVDFNDI